MTFEHHLSAGATATAGRRVVLDGQGVRVRFTSTGRVPHSARFGPWPST